MDLTGQGRKDSRYTVGRHCLIKAHVSSITKPNSELHFQGITEAH